MSNNIYTDFVFEITELLNSIEEFKNSYDQRSDYNFKKTRKSFKEKSGASKMRSETLARKHRNIIFRLYSEYGMAHGIVLIYKNLKKYPYNLNQENTRADVSIVLDSLVDIDIRLNNNEKIKDVFSVKDESHITENIKNVCNKFKLNSNELRKQLNDTFNLLNKVSFFIVKNLAPDENDIDRKQKEEAVKYIKSFMRRISDESLTKYNEDNKISHNVYGSNASSQTEYNSGANTTQVNQTALNPTVTNQKYFNVEKSVKDIINIADTGFSLCKIYDESKFRRADPLQFVKAYNEIESMYDNEIIRVRKIFDSIISSLTKLQSGLNLYKHKHESVIQKNNLLENKKILEDNFVKNFNAILNYENVISAASNFNILEDEDVLLVCKDLIENKGYTAKHLLRYCSLTIHTLGKFKEMFQTKG